MPLRPRALALLSFAAALLSCAAAHGWRGTAGERRSADEALYHAAKAGRPADARAALAAGASLDYRSAVRGARPCRRARAALTPRLAPSERKHAPPHRRAGGGAPAGGAAAGGARRGAGGDGQGAASAAALPPRSGC